MKLGVDAEMVTDHREERLASTIACCTDDEGTRAGPGRRVRGCSDAGQGMLRKMPANDRHWVDVWVSR
jgi:hypothetical protein